MSQVTTKFPWRQPWLAMTQPKNWIEEIFALLHNPIRREIMDMHYLVVSMDQRVPNVTIDDIHEFYVWFHMFQIFLRDFFLLQRRVLIPWINEKYTSSWELKESQSFLASISNSTKTITHLQSKLQSIPSKETLSLLNHAIDRFSPRLIHFLKTIENTVPEKIFQSMGSAPLTEMQIQGHTVEITHAILKFYQERPNGHVCMRIIFRSMTDLQKMHDMRNQYVHVKGVFRTLKLKKSFAKSRDLFREAHSEIVRKSHRQWNEAKVVANENFKYRQRMAQ